MDKITPKCRWVFQMGKSFYPTLNECILERYGEICWHSPMKYRDEYLRFFEDYDFTTCRFFLNLKRVNFYNEIEKLNYGSASVLVMLHTNVSSSCGFFC